MLFDLVKALGQLPLHVRIHHHLRSVHGAGVAVLHGKAFRNLGWKGNPISKNEAKRKAGQFVGTVTPNEKS